MRGLALKAVGGGQELGLVGVHGRLSRWQPLQPEFADRGDSRRECRAENRCPRGAWDAGWRLEVKPRGGNDLCETATLSAGPAGERAVSTCETVLGRKGQVS